MAPMEKIFKEWFDRNKDERNSMFTTEDLEFDEGTAQLKWWKDMGTIIVKIIQLTEDHRGKGEFTAVAKKMLDWPGVEIIEMESVLDDDLSAKLIEGGFWKSKFLTYYGGGMNLVARKEKYEELFF